MQYLSLCVWLLFISIVSSCVLSLWDIIPHSRGQQTSFRGHLCAHSLCMALQAKRGYYIFSWTKSNNILYHFKKWYQLQVAVFINHIGTQPCLSIYRSSLAAFQLWQENLNSHNWHWPVKSKTRTIWPLTEEVCQLMLYGYQGTSDISTQDRPSSGTYTKPTVRAPQPSASTSECRVSA